MKTAQTVGAIEADFAGEQVNLIDGGLSFSAVDIDIPGNNALPVRLARSYRVFNRKEYPFAIGTLADWELDLPSISGVFAPNWSGYTSSTSPYRCSQSGPYATTNFGRHEWWTGLSLSLPNGGGGLLGVAAGTQTPTTGGPYPLMTNGQVFIACLSSIRNGTGEGFLAITPDGTKYWFDHMAQYIEAPIQRLESDLNGNRFTHTLDRRKNVLYATRVEDRFGNSVTYKYSNASHQGARLDSITSSDGRSIVLGYDGAGHLATATAGTRVWKYGYGSTGRGLKTLTSVTNPDLSQWTIGFAGFTDAQIVYSETYSNDWVRDCFTHQIADNETVRPQGQITHPSGATAMFVVGIVEHNKSNVPISCSYVTTTPGEPLGASNNPNDDINFWVISYQQFSLLSKTVTGPALPAAGYRWDYSYDSDYSAYLTGGGTLHFPYCSDGTFKCGTPRCVDDTCAGTARTTVQGPDGRWTRYVHGNSFKYNDGKLLRVEEGKGTAPALRITRHAYDLSRANTPTYPASYGHSLKGDGDGFADTYVRPLVRTTIEQDSATFERKLEALDYFAHPVRTVRWSSLGYSRTDRTDYQHDYGRWVIGQVTQTTNEDTGLVEAQTDYDLGTLLPRHMYAFGKLERTLGYHADGTLASVTDGRNLTTQLSDWMRGIPQVVTFADGGVQKVAVNDAGWVTAATDEAGSTTCYLHDEMGRLTRLTHPTEKATPTAAAGTCSANDWNETFISFEASSTAAHGLPAGHWRRMEVTGAAKTISYLDALWRPVVEEAQDVNDVAQTTSQVVKRYDASGQITFASYPRNPYQQGAVTWDQAIPGTHTVFDGLGRPTISEADSEHGRLATVIDYLPGFVRKTTNPRGIATLERFQAFDEPSYERPVQIDAAVGQPEAARTTITRDEFGKPLQMTRGATD